MDGMMAVHPRWAFGRGRGECGEVAIRFVSCFRDEISIRTHLGADKHGAVERATCNLLARHAPPDGLTQAGARLIERFFIRPRSTLQGRPDARSESATAGIRVRVAD